MRPTRRSILPTIPCILALLACLASACGKLSSPGVVSAPATDGVDVDASSLVGDDAGPVAYDEDGAAPVAWEAGIPPSPDAAPLPTTGDDAGDATVWPGVDATPDGACDHPPGTGDLLVDELMIESVVGAGDDGEWLEISNMAGCALDLRGLHGDAPVGAKVHTFDIGVDAWVPAGGSFLVADSADPSINHELPGMLFTWSGTGGDILRNEGGTVTLTVGDTLVTSITWPKLKLIAGTSVELPATCSPDQSDDFTVWQDAQSSWFPAFFGTPNAPNDDVTCPP